VIEAGTDDLADSPPAADIHLTVEAQPERHDLACIDVGNMHGLEIGPLANPIVRKDQGNVLYVDHATAEELRHKYLFDPGMKDRLDEIVDVDYVVGQSQGVYDAVMHDVPFDYVMASHLIEHIPDPVGWLMDVARVLRVGGILSLVIPDKRYSFDIKRRTTDISEVIDAYLRRLKQPSFNQVYDFVSKAMVGRVDTASVWAGTEDYANNVVRSDGKDDPDVGALNVCRVMEQSDSYLDVHCSVFTPDSFLEIYEKLARLGLMDFEIAYFATTKPNDLQFFVSLRRMDPALEPDSMKNIQLQSLLNIESHTTAVATNSDSSGAAAITMEVSGIEHRLIATKRRIIERMRASFHRSN
jgi:hypothetical protein